MVSNATIRRDTFRLIRTLLDTNKPTGWTVRAVLPNVTTAFPLIFIHPVNAPAERWSLTNANHDYDIVVPIEIMVHIDSSPSVLDTGRDNVCATLTDETNLNTLYNDDDLVFEGLDDIGQSTRDVNDQEYITASFLLRMKKK